MAVPAFNAVLPIPVKSPNGVMVRPKIMTFVSGNLLITEAHWICPQTIRLFKKGTISIKEQS